ncbi:MAG: MltA domain-containing protein, partial [Desulfobacula sp.]|nr:MltA domain-containing protein [Desulfobacula sp.]
MPLKPIRVFLLVVMVCCFTGCRPGVKEKGVPFTALKKLNPQQYPLFMDRFDFQDLVVSIDHSLAYFKRVPRERQFQYGNERYSAAHMIVSLETIKAFLVESPSTKALNDFIRCCFTVYAAAGNEEGDMLFTGYFEPTYEGRLSKSDAYPYSVYSRPSDLLEIDLSAFSDQYKGHKRLVARVNDATNRVVPYYSRAQINSLDAFHTTSVPVVWLKSRVDRFFLEIQGSGRIDLGQGEVLRVHYAGTNGNAYRSIGRYLIRKNEILKE